ncbi:MAG: hypothetical protein ACLVJX_07195 [Merdibacter sp.]
MSDLQYPLLALVVSGGHTELVCLKDENSFEVLGETQDDAIGEAFDKVARVMGFLPGRTADRPAGKEGNNVYALAKPKTENPMDFSFSGLRAACCSFRPLRADRKTSCRQILPAAFRKRHWKHCFPCDLRTDHVSGIRHFVVAGGVAANSRLRTLITETIAPELPADRFTIRRCPAVR